jgi:hypothetical protein
MVTIVIISNFSEKAKNKKLSGLIYPVILQKLSQIMFFNLPIFQTGGHVN